MEAILRRDRASYSNKASEVEPRFDHSSGERYETLENIVHVYSRDVNSGV